MEIFHLPEKSWSQATHGDLSVNITNPGAWATAREIDLGGEEASRKSFHFSLSSENDVNPFPASSLSLHLTFYCGLVLN